MTDTRIRYLNGVSIWFLTALFLKIMTSTSDCQATRLETENKTLLYITHFFSVSYDETYLSKTSSWSTISSLSLIVSIASLVKLLRASSNIA